MEPYPALKRPFDRGARNVMTEQSAKANARRSVAMADRPGPGITVRALANAQQRMPSQTLTASRLPDGTGQVEHHDKDRVISEFDDPATHRIESPIRAEPRRASRQP